MKLDDILNKNVMEVIEYKQADNGSLRILVKKPVDWSRNDARTAVVWIHGGGWQGGNPEMFLPHMEYFSKRGAVAFSVQYRLAKPEGPTVEDCLKDCMDAIAYIKDNSEALGIDPEKIAVGGDSAGGHLANCIGSPKIFYAGKKDRPPVNCIINCNGIVDLTMKWRSGLYYDSSSQGITVDEWTKQYERCRRLSPVFNISENNSPMLILHGLDDKVVEPEEAMRYYHELKSRGVDVEIELIPGVGHAFILFDYKLSNDSVFEILQKVDRYLVSRGLLAE